MKKLVCLFLAFALLAAGLTLLASCGEDGKNDPSLTTTHAGTTGEGPLVESLPENLNFDNTEVKFLSCGHSSIGSPFHMRSVGIADYVLGRNPVDDAVYTRDQSIEETYGVIITSVGVESELVRCAHLSDLQSGSSEFDVLQGYQIFDIPLCLQGILLNINSLREYDANYITLKKSTPYWNKTYSDAFTYKKNRFWITGDLTLTYLGGLHATFVNTEEYENVLRPVYKKSIYEIVRDKEWTLETLADMCKISFRDTGTREGKTDMGDFLGFFTGRIDDNYAVASDIRFSSMDPSNTPVLEIGTDNSRLLEYMTKMHNLLYGDYAAITSLSSMAENLAFFANGNCMFFDTFLMNAEVGFTGMENYGILPNPMLNAEQKEYHTEVHDGCGIFGIYTNCDCIPAAAATLEAMAALSYRTVTPAYYDMALKNRYTRDPDSSEMVDLLRDTAYMDFFLAWNQRLNGGDYIAKFFSNACASEPTASVIVNAQGVWEGNLAKLLTDLDKVGSLGQ